MPFPLLREFGKTRLLLALTLGLLAGVVGLGIALALYAQFTYSKIYTVPPPVPVSASPTPTPDPLAPFGVLLLGFGGPAHDGGYLTDTLLLAYVEPRRERVVLVSLPRDLWVELPISESERKPYKVNAAYAVGRDHKRYPNKPSQYLGDGGGGVLAKEVVGSVTGLPVSYYAAVSFAGFVKGVDVLGGVPVRVPVAFSDPLYPIEGKKADLCGISQEELAARSATLSGAKLEESFACRYETLNFAAGNQILDGQTALKYVRSRHSPTSGGDAARAARQRAVLSGVREQVFRVQFLPKLVPFLNSITADMQMDIDPVTLQKWIANAEEYRNYEIVSLEVSEKTILKPATSADRQYILVPREGDRFDFTAVQAYIRSELERTATQSAAVVTE